MYRQPDGPLPYVKVQRRLMRPPRQRASERVKRPWNDRLCNNVDVDILDLAARRRHRITVCAHSFNMKLDRLADICFDLSDRRAGRYAPWQARYVR